MESPPKRRGRPPSNPLDLAQAAQAARNAICDAAVVLFEQGGVDAINMRDIGKVLNVSQMMAYRYFPSKDHLMMELRIRAFARFSASLERARRGAPAPAISLPRVCAAYLIFAYHKPHDYRLMFDMWAFENISTMKAEFGEKVRKQAASWLEIQKAVGEFLGPRAASADLGEVTDIVWATLHGICSLHLARKLVFGRAIKQLARPLIRSLLAGITPRE